ncbi:type III secretion system ATPase SctN [Candidatus Similichlamydia epinepheli]|uniref:type III secretion system ATPase SctN n=1 Tax=Candidatus Similichlamydia epinepheli TaxID=1903953 RepID=UPI00195A1DFB|nr:type III secretion system ATPase SctN [Candidatus Similichlamydia epinepheli]
MDFAQHLSEALDLENVGSSLNLNEVNGRITQVLGMLIKAVIPEAVIGELCMIRREGAPPLRCEVVGFTKDEVLLSPLGEMSGIAPSSEVIRMRRPLSVRVGPGLLGRILNGLGEPIDTEQNGPLKDVDIVYPVYKNPPDPFKRKRIESPISVGVRCIDAILTCGEGQRLGIFGAAGGGKSVLMGMIAKYSHADVNVVVLVGERGRELRDFIEKDLGKDGLKRSVIVVATSDQPSQVRMNAAYVGTAIAEYYRDQGLKVILMMDSVTRFARAIREIGLAAGEPPARGGFTPSVFATLPKLMERSGNSDKGSITAFYTVLVAGDDMNEPVADETLSILDGHFILSADLARVQHYPAIDVLRSKSRVMNMITAKDHQQASVKLLEALAIYKKNELLINMGEYKRGTNRSIDYAIDRNDSFNRFLKQSSDDRSTLEEAIKQLKGLVR